MMFMCWLMESGLPAFTLQRLHLIPHSTCASCRAKFSFWLRPMQILSLKRRQRTRQKVAVGRLMYILCTMPIIVPGGPCSAINYQETTMTKRKKQKKKSCGTSGTKKQCHSKTELKKRQPGWLSFVGRFTALSYILSPLLRQFVLLGVSIKKQTSDS